jgi:heme-degrading monooxygenase HmoA
VTGLYARVTTLEGPPDKIDDATRHVREQTLPQLRQMDGFEGFVTLVDRQSGKQLAVALWESEEALRATEEAVSSMRSGVAEAAGATVAGVERYEVAVFEVPSAGPISGVTDTLGGVTDTLGGATGSVTGVTDKLLGGGGGEEEEKQQR